MKAAPNIKPLKMLEKVWNLMFAKNPQVEDPPCVYPTIVLPEEPKDFSNFGSLNAYMYNLEENW